MNPSHILARWAERSPNREAVISEGGRLTWSALRERVQALAGGLERLGAGRGDRVGVLLYNCPEFLEAYFAICHLGAILVPLNFRLAGPEFAYILEDAGVKILITDASFHPTIGPIQGQLPRLAHVLCVGGDVPPGWESYEERLERARGRRAPAAQVDLGDVQRIMYTSGTTSRPKGAMITHGNVYWKNVAHVMDLNLTAADRTLVVGPLYHVGGLDLPATGVLYMGGSVVILPRFDAERVLAAVHAEGVTNVWLAPTMIAQVLARTDIDRFDLTSLRIVIDGGEKMPIPLIEELRRVIPSCGFHDAYGLTETVSGDTFLPPADAVRKTGSVGLPTYQLRVRVVDDERRDLPAGELGEVLLRGPKVFPGYWNNREASEAVLVDGWFHTGDIGRMDGEGYLYIVDRKKDIIISGGENIASTEVERVIYEDPRVAECAVIGVSDERWGEVPYAFVVPKPGHRDIGEEILARCAASLAKFKVPKGVTFIDALPRNPSGKVLKRDLRERAASVRRGP
ncbi:MAG: long-chain fatty acid--CoA ligase [Candidatus Tectomicrobia bacterium]|uniref:Long-chain fatty acid--CoA ligase n=1 Tax=Tectimicrobiota bacterium TaxID=2528274 RepID=A0A932MR37_UNCTE|nr:long-chain fatty acid--CoA ligase [Candidatus Tectomicrobia bacterium]